MSVTPIRKESRDLVVVLEELLEGARAGRVTALMGAFMIRGEDGQLKAGDVRGGDWPSSVFELLAGLSYLSVRTVVQTDPVLNPEDR